MKKNDARFTLIFRDLTSKEYSALTLGAMDVNVEGETIYGRLVSPNNIQYENEVKQEVEKTVQNKMVKETPGDNIPAEFDLDLVVNTVIQELYPYLGKTIQKNIDKGIKKGELDVLQETETPETKAEEPKPEPKAPEVTEQKEEAKVEAPKEEPKAALSSAVDDVMGGEQVAQATKVQTLVQNEPAPKTAPPQVEEAKAEVEATAVALEGPYGPVQREAIAEYLNQALEIVPEDAVLKGFMEWFTKTDDKTFLMGQNLLNLAQTYVTKQLWKNQEAMQEAYSLLTTVYQGFNIKAEAVKTFEEKYAN